MKTTENIVEEILRDVNSEILDYNGNNLVNDHIIDSLCIVEIVSGIEDRFGIEINPEEIVWTRFMTIETIIKFVKELVEK